MFKKIPFVLVVLLSFPFVSSSYASWGCSQVLFQSTSNWPKTNLGRRFVRSLKTEDFYLSREFIELLGEDARFAQRETLGAPVAGVDGDGVLEVDMGLSMNWSALHFGSVISTPLSVLVKMSESLQFPSGAHIVDIGSGHGLPGFVFGALNPFVSFTGFDIVPAKVKYAKVRASEFGLSNVSFIEQDLGERGFELPIADYFYLYNPVNDFVLNRLSLQIYNMARSLKPGLKVITYYNERVHAVFLDLGFKVVSYDETNQMYVLTL